MYNKTPPTISLYIYLDKEKITNLIQTLLKNNVIYKDPDFKKYYYRVLQLNDATVEEACCLVDPFCYISHLSAMKKYDLTNRIPTVSIFSTPNKPLWKTMKDKLEQSLLPKPLNQKNYSPIRKSTFPATVRQMKIKRIETKYYTSYKYKTFPCQNFRNRSNICRYDRKT